MESTSSVDFYFLLIGGTLAFLLLAGGIVFFVLSYKRRILKKDLEIQMQEAAHQRDLFDRNLEATENERTRVARELHDEVGSSLSMMRLLSTECNIENENLKELIDNTIDNVRRISNDLLPSGLEEFGLEHALEILFEKTQDNTDVEIESHLHPLPELSQKQNLMTYRIIQEMINNSIKYSESTNWYIEIGMVSNEVVISYRDNGKGVDLTEAMKKNSLGLKNLKARAEYLGGNAVLDSAKGQGFKAEIKFPVLNENNKHSHS